MLEKIKIENGVVKTPPNPVIPFIEGDGIGKDIWKTAQKVFDGAVDLVYGGNRTVHWKEIFAGEKAYNTGFHHPLSILIWLIW
jgi:isocitrate dehydrogenase